MILLFHNFENNEICGVLDSNSFILATQHDCMYLWGCLVQILGLARDLGSHLMIPNGPCFLLSKIHLGNLIP